MNSRLASTEAQLLQARLPAGTRVVFNARDFTIVDLIITPKLATRCWIGFDTDRDERVLDVISALYLRNRQIAGGCVGFAETRGDLQVWYAETSESLGMAQLAMQGACTAALFPYDQWRALPLIRVQTKPDGTVDRDQLGIRDLLRTAPEKYRLGRVKL